MSEKEMNLNPESEAEETVAEETAEAQEPVNEYKEKYEYEDVAAAARAHGLSYAEAEALVKGR